MYNEPAQAQIVRFTVELEDLANARLAGKSLTADANWNIRAPTPGTRNPPAPNQMERNEFMCKMCWCFIPSHVLSETAFLPAQSLEARQHLRQAWTIHRAGTSILEVSFPAAGAFLSQVFTHALPCSLRQGVPASQQERFTRSQSRARPWRRRCLDRTEPTKFAAIKRGTRASGRWLPAKPVFSPRRTLEADLGPLG